MYFLSVACEGEHLFCTVNFVYFFVLYIETRFCCFSRYIFYSEQIFNFLYLCLGTCALLLGALLHRGPVHLELEQIIVFNPKIFHVFFCPFGLYICDPLSMQPRHLISYTEMGEGGWSPDAGCNRGALIETYSAIPVVLQIIVQAIAPPSGQVL